MPRIPGTGTFQGRSFHTYRWPQEPVDFARKRVAVAGVGATGVQVVQTIAPPAGRLTVFQRMPNRCTPLRNRQITEVAFEAADFLFNPQGTLHGGVLATALGIAMGHLINRQAGPGTTLEMKVQYLAPVRDARVVCHGEALRETGSCARRRAARRERWPHFRPPPGGSSASRRRTRPFGRPCPLP